MTRNSRTAVLIAWGLTAVLLAACDDSSDPTAPITRVRQSLVGTWKGTLKSDAGTNPLDFTLTLRADSTMLSDVPFVNPICPGNGTWTSSLTEMTATGRDCQGVVVTWTGLISVERLRGTFSTSTGVRGTFDVAKQMP